MITMNTIVLSLFFVFFSLTALSQTVELPREWVDPETGHRILRLSDEAGSQSFYFHQNGYAGSKLVFETRTGLSTLDFKTKKIEQIVDGRARAVVVGNKSGKVFYRRLCGPPYTANTDAI